MSTPNNTTLQRHASFFTLVALPAFAVLLLILLAPSAYASSSDNKFTSAVQAGTLAVSDTYTLSLPLVMTGCKPISPEYPVCVLTTGSAALYSGPGSGYYTWLGNLPPKQSVAPLARYGDYAKVAAVVNGSVRIGFVPPSALSPLPPGLPILGAADVPWKQINLARYFLYNANTSGVESALLIDNQSTSDYQDYMPMGLSALSPFSLTFQIETNNDDYGTVKLADVALPPTSEWWKGVRRMDIATQEGKLRVEIHDGASEALVLLRQWNVSDQQAITMYSIDSTGKIFEFYDQSGRQIDRIDVTKLPSTNLAGGLFPVGKAHFGRVVAPATQLTIRSLSLQLQPSGVAGALPAVVQEPTLRRLGQARGISLGTEFGWWWMIAEPEYRQIMENAYDTLILSEFTTPEFWPARGVYRFENMDWFIDWALRYGYRVRASHLVWGAVESNAVPEWLIEGDYTRDEYIQILEEHVKTVVGHYKGRVQEWSIANEAIGRSGVPGSDFWNEKIGPEYISMAFRWARETDPNAVLIFNEVNNEDPRDDDTEWIVETMLAKVKDLKEQGVPIDVVGMQMHLLLPICCSPIPPEKADVIETMQRFGALGVKIYITEMDVNLEAVQGTQGEKWRFEADLYRAMAEACIESGVCTSFSTWGITDKHSWITCTEWPGCQKLVNADPLMFDKDYQPKSAFFAVYDAFAQGIDASGSGEQ